MRLHISLEEGLVSDIDRLAGPRGRSEFIAKAIRTALDRERRWQSFEAAAGSIPDHGHGWDEDAAGWARTQRRADSRRVG